MYWYNRKYQRCGHLFQDRYKSEAVEDDRYFLTVLRYIHRNPVKAGIVKDIADYKWSSYSEYMGNSKIIDTDFVLKLFNDDKEKAIVSFMDFHDIISPRPIISRTQPSSTPLSISVRCSITISPCYYVQPI